MYTHYEITTVLFYDKLPERLKTDADVIDYIYKHNRYDNQYAFPYHSYEEALDRFNKRAEYSHSYVLKDGVDIQAFFLEKVDYHFEDEEYVVDNRQILDSSYISIIGKPVVDYWERYREHYRKELDGKRYAICSYGTCCYYDDLIEDGRGWTEEMYLSLIDESDLEIEESFDSLEDARQVYEENYSETDFDGDDSEVYFKAFMLVEFDDGDPNILEESKGVLTMEELEEWSE